MKGKKHREGGVKMLAVRNFLFTYIVFTNSIPLNCKDMSKTQGFSQTIPYVGLWDSNSMIMEVLA